MVRETGTGAGAGLAGNFRGVRGRSQVNLTNSSRVGVSNTVLNALLIPRFALAGAAAATATSAVLLVLLQNVQLARLEGVRMDLAKVGRPWLGWIALGCSLFALGAPWPDRPLLRGLVVVAGLVAGGAGMPSGDVPSGLGDAAVPGLPTCCGGWACTSPSPFSSTPVLPSWWMCAPNTVEPGVPTTRVARPIEMFSPVEMRMSSTSLLIASSALTSPVAPLASAASASFCAVSMKPSFFAVKSVSARSSTIAAAE